MRKFHGKDTRQDIKVSKKSLKRFAALLASGLMTISLKASAIMIKNGEDSTSHPYKIVEQMEDRELSDFEKTQIEAYRKQLMEQFDSSNVKLDSIYITSVYIEGTKVRVELKDNSSVEGEATNLEFGRLKLENFYFNDIEYIDNEKTEYNDNTTEKESSKKLEIEYSQLFSSIKVNNEFKFFNNSSTDMFFVEWMGFIDLSNASKVWIGGGVITEKKIREITRSDRLECLYFTDQCIICIEDANRILKIDSKTVKTIIINPSETDNYRINDFDFTGCKELKEVSIGNGTSIENMNGLKDLPKIELVAFGDFMAKENDNKSFEEMKLEPDYTYSIDGEEIAKPANNFISDISALKTCKNLRILNISQLYCVSSDKLFDVVSSLPNFKIIVGQKINNAVMCSDELIEYCNEHKIKQPFNEKSLEIKHKLTKTVAEVTTPDMKEKEKVGKLSEYIVNHMSYIDPKDDIAKGWGEALGYAVLDGEGLCFGYASYTTALFTEAGIQAGKLESEGHAFNYFKIGDDYFYLDLTDLDNVFGDSPDSVKYWFSDSELYSGVLFKIYGNFEEKYGVFSIPAGARKPIKQNYGATYKFFAFLGLCIALRLAGRITRNVICIRIENEERKEEWEKWYREEYVPYFCESPKKNESGAR